MLGIVIKDYYETFCLKKNIIGMIFSLSVILLVVALIDNLYAFVLIVGITLPMMGASTLQSSMEQDEISKFDQILLTFPITRQEIVKAKLLSSFIYFSSNKSSNTSCFNSSISAVSAILKFGDTFSSS